MEREEVKIFVRISKVFSYLFLKNEKKTFFLIIIIIIIIIVIIKYYIINIYMLR